MSTLRVQTKPRRNFYSDWLDQQKNYANKFEKQSEIWRELMKLRGARLAVAYETADGVTLDDAKIKRVASTDTIAARGLHKDSIEFLPTHKTVLVTNHKPKMNATDYGTWRRVCLILFGTIGQVHRAVLEDGERVVVKVQRPTAQHDIFRDLSLLELFAEKTANRQALSKIVDISAAIEHLSDSLRRELDFKLEGENVERLRAALGQFERLDAPRVHDGLSTSRLLVLEEIPGVPVREMPADAERHDMARQLLEFYYRQILVEGFFHADPHPGNMLWSDGRIYFLDFGMVGELTPEMRGHLLLLLLAFWQEDVAFLTEVVLIMAGPEAEHADAAGLEADLGELLRRHRHTSLGEIQLGPLLQEIAQSAVTSSSAATALDPELDPFAVVGRFLMRNLLSRAQAGVEPKRLFYDVQKLKTRAERLIEAFERISGSRPGQRLQVDVRGISPLERTIRVAARRVALAVTAGSALVATGTTAAATHLASWVPVTLGSLGGTFTGLLLLDLLRGGRQR